MLEQDIDYISYQVNLAGVISAQYLALSEGLVNKNIRPFQFLQSQVMYIMTRNQNNQENLDDKFNKLIEQLAQTNKQLITTISNRSEIKLAEYNYIIPFLKNQDSKISNIIQKTRNAKDKDIGQLQQITKLYEKTINSIIEQNNINNDDGGSRMKKHNNKIITNIYGQGKKIPNKLFCSIVDNKRWIFIQDIMQLFDNSLIQTSLIIKNIEQLTQIYKKQRNSFQIQIQRAVSIQEKNVKDYLSKLQIRQTQSVMQIINSKRYESSSVQDKYSFLKNNICWRCATIILMIMDIQLEREERDQIQQSLLLILNKQNVSELTNILKLYMNDKPELLDVNLMPIIFESQHIQCFRCKVYVQEMINLNRLISHSKVVIKSMQYIVSWSSQQFGQSSIKSSFLNRILIDIGSNLQLGYGLINVVQFKEVMPMIMFMYQHRFGLKWNDSMYWWYIGSPIYKKRIDDYIQKSQGTVFYQQLIGSQTAYGFVAPLKDEQFIDQLKLWANPKQLTEISHQDRKQQLYAIINNQELTLDQQLVVIMNNYNLKYDENYDKDKAMIDYNSFIEFMNECFPSKILDEKQLYTTYFGSLQSPGNTRGLGISKTNLFQFLLDSQLITDNILKGNISFIQQILDDRNMLSIKQQQMKNDLILVFEFYAAQKREQAKLRQFVNTDILQYVISNTTYAIYKTLVESSINQNTGYAIQIWPNMNYDQQSKVKDLWTTKQDQLSGFDFYEEYEWFPFPLDYAQFDFNVQTWMVAVCTSFFLRLVWPDKPVIMVFEAILNGSYINYNAWQSWIKQGLMSGLKMTSGFGSIFNLYWLWLFKQKQPTQINLKLTYVNGDDASVMIKGFEAALQLLQLLEQIGVNVSAVKNRMLVGSNWSCDFLRTLYLTRNSLYMGFKGRLASSSIFKKPWTNDRASFQADENLIINESDMDFWKQFQRRGIYPDILARLMVIQSIKQMNSGLDYNQIVYLMSFSSYDNSIYEVRLKLYMGKIQYTKRMFNDKLDNIKLQQLQSQGTNYITKFIDQLLIQRDIISQPWLINDIAKQVTIEQEFNTVDWIKDFSANGVQFVQITSQPIYITDIYKQTTKSILGVGKTISFNHPLPWKISAISAKRLLLEEGKQPSSWLYKHPTFQFLKARSTSNDVLISWISEGLQWRTDMTVGEPIVVSQNGRQQQTMSLGNMFNISKNSLAQVQSIIKPMSQRSFI